MAKVMTKAEITKAQKAGGLNAAQRAADNREDAKARTNVLTKAVHHLKGEKRRAS